MVTKEQIDTLGKLIVQYGNTCVNVGMLHEAAELAGQQHKRAQLLSNIKAQLQGLAYPDFGRWAIFVDGNDSLEFPCTDNIDSARGLINEKVADGYIEEGDEFHIVKVIASGSARFHEETRYTKIVELDGFPDEIAYEGED